MNWEQSAANGTTIIVWILLALGSALLAAIAGLSAFGMAKVVKGRSNPLIALYCLTIFPVLNMIASLCVALVVMFAFSIYLGRDAMLVFLRTILDIMSIIWSSFACVYATIKITSASIDALKKDNEALQKQHAIMFVAGMVISCAYLIILAANLLDINWRTYLGGSIIVTANAIGGYQLLKKHLTKQSYDKE